MQAGMVRGGRTEAIAAACVALGRNDPTSAAELIGTHYPHVPVSPAKRGYTIHQMLATYTRDGFIDRYSGERLLFPGVLHVLSLRLPAVVPRHPNWKMSETHIAYWDLMPTMDHVKPIARGGSDDPSNWVTTSMRRNSAKSNWTLEELGWSLQPPGDIGEWDGLLGWFEAYVEAHPELLAEPRVKRWAWATTYRRRGEG